MTDRVGKIKAALSKVSGVAMLAVVALLATGQAGAAMPYDPIYQQQRSRRQCRYRLPNHPFWPVITF